ncbi:PH and SEC7 domain-containing protein 1-like isoform X2 [Hemitrygon akajei]|uniref:PH and SEC7 domain-containing protein 1-like isoform X2 n=1 Tax=Hemitrygon akajei TaxID=2704970 RepID=UPI003BF9EB36
MAQNTEVMTFYMELRTAPSRNGVKLPCDSPRLGSWKAAQCDATTQSPCRLSANSLSPRPHVQRRSLPPDSRVDFLGLPGRAKGVSSLVRTQSETNPFRETTPSSPGRSTAPTSPVGIRTRSFCPATLENTIKKVGVSARGKSSVVTFSYIEKSKVKTIVNPLNSSMVPQDTKPPSTSAGYRSPSPGLNLTKMLLGFASKLPQTGSLDTVTLGASSRPSDRTVSNQGSALLLGSGSPVCSDAQDSSIGLRNGNKIDQVLTSRPMQTRSLDLGTKPVTAFTVNDTSISNGILSNHGSELSIGRESPNSPGFKQAFSCTWAREHSERAQKIAKARREFFYGTSEPQAPEDKGEPGIQQPLANLHITENNEAAEEKQKEPFAAGPSEAWKPVCQGLGELHGGLKGPPLPNGNCAAGGVSRETRYSETDLDAVPVRCYQETNLDEVMAEYEMVGPAGCQSLHLPGSVVGCDAQRDHAASPVETAIDDSPGGGEESRGEQPKDPEDEVFYESCSAVADRSPDTEVKNLLPSVAPVSLSRSFSEDGTDTFSKQFECILESHCAKGTSYTSLDSVEILACPRSSQGNYFTFDFPTLTSEIQEQIKQNARLIEEKFLTCSNTSSSTGSRGDLNQPESPKSQGSRADRNPSANPMVGYSKSENLLSKCQLYTGNNLLKGVLEIGADEPNSDYSSSDSNLNHLVMDSESEMDSTEQLALGSTDTLANGNKTDQEAAKRLAKRLYYLDGFKRSDVARHLGKNNDFSKMVAEEYLRFFDFTGLSLDHALRAFLKEFALMGETQERERVLIHFSHRYHQCNPDTISAEDGVHTLTCALMLLNTDLHGHNIGKRMSCSDFISNLEGLNDGKDFPKDLLKVLYSSIKNEKLQWTINEEELRKSLSELADERANPSLKTMKRISSGSNPFLDIMQDPNAATYKHGFLVRKVHADSDGKKTPRGRRGWKTFYGVLKGMILYLQKDAYKSDKQLSEEDLKNAISIHHSLAVRASDYSKKPNVFYLKTADWRVFLLQAPSSELMQSWITRINLVSAMFSAPPFPAAIGSQKKFSRPLLPTAVTRLSLEEQIKAHEARLKAMTADLAEHHSVPPDKKAKTKELEEYKQKEEYLEFEEMRFCTYVSLLRAKLKAGTDDLDKFDAALFDTAESEGNGLKKSRSSPSLNLEQPAAVIRVKRNTSERRSSRHHASTKHKL